PTAQSDPQDPRSATFTIGHELDGIKLYGGFQGLSHPGGGETELTQRNPALYPTHLHCEYAPIEDRLYHIVTAVNVGQSTRIDGFWLENGRASESGTDQDRGGGLLLKNANPLLLDARSGTIKRLARVE